MSSTNVVWTDFVSGSLTSQLAAIAAGSSQTMTSEGLKTLGRVNDPADPNYPYSPAQTAKIVLDPFGDKGSPELVTVTSHVSGSNTATIQRIAGQPLRTHSASETWIHGPTAEDFTSFQGQLDSQFKATLFTTGQQLLYSTAANTPAALSKGANSQVLSVVGGNLAYQYVQGIYQQQITTNNSAISTETTICTKSFSAFGYGGIMECSAFWTGLNDTLNDQFQLRVKIDGVTVGSGTFRPSIGNGRSLFSIPTTQLHTFTNTDTPSVTVTVVRITGSGTIREDTPGWLTIKTYMLTAP